MSHSSLEPERALLPLCVCSRLDLSIEVLCIDPQLLSGHSVAAKLYHDTPDLTEAQPVLETTLDLTGQGPSTSDRMAGSKAHWHRGTAQVSHPSCLSWMPLAVVASLL